MFDQYLRTVLECVDNRYGDDFFSSITLQLDRIIAADYTFIARLNTHTHSARTIALVAKGELTDNIEYDLKHTPCENVADDSVCCYPADVCQAFPNDQLLVDMKIDAYLGTPLKDSNGQVIGLIVALYETPIKEEELTQALFEVFSGRIAAEIERQEYETALEKLNQSLEEKVDQRTKELQKALLTLNKAQQQLIESEKMAALGNLVAGIAHEVNTPLGVAITSQSYLADQFKELCQQMDQETLTKEGLLQFREDMAEALPLLYSNLTRAAELIQNFKRIAADQHEDRADTITLDKYYKQVVSTLHPLLKEQAVDITLDIPGINIYTYPSAHAQILSNLIKNSVMHGFADTPGEHLIQLHGQLTDHGKGVKITYRDNGAGINEDTRKRIFEPFYTTARHKGAVGLGMSIVYNLIKQNLNGELELLNSEAGLMLEYSFPVSGIPSDL
ncbi:sensor histidine kinase [Oceanospirillum beijerinckii]|uniref:sensor histidine kinase n=1 Tax=Oceanospirillum beijerinckii TaxID=64976 RepID=UPI000428FA83|nr:ATP-binding protein [Oceanospirillum beijerinckii]